jgi:CRISPR-associated protein Csx17
VKARMSLRGCAPEPLIHYLKALGVLRLVAEQLDLRVHGAWRGDTFVIETEKSEDELVEFFLNEYRPTPIVAPWNGSSGFYPKDKKQREALETLCKANPARLADYIETVAAARRIVGKRTDQPKDADKMQMLQLARQSFPERALDWLDAAFVLAQDKPDYPPILGSGGNDGRLDFTVNFYLRLSSVLPESFQANSRSQKRTRQCVAKLRASLFGGIASLERAAVGQFHPAGAGGTNGTEGISGGSYVNPWDFILALEGSLLLASATVRQLAAGSRTRASFPFTVQSSNVGYGSATGGEKIRAEVWLPLWSRLAGYREIAHIFKEGRVQFRDRRLVRTGFDFARAIAELGVDRGIDAFQRYAFIERNGQANLATPLGVFYVKERPLAALVQQASRWLDSFSRATADEQKTPPRLVRAHKHIEEAIFNLCARGTASELRETLVAVGAGEAELAKGQKFREEKNVRPLAGLSLCWLHECNDKTPEFRIAAALASIRGQGDVGGFRTNLEPFDEIQRDWAKRSSSVVWSGADLQENLAAVLHRRSVEARMQALPHPPLVSSRFASLADIGAFLSYGTDDQKIEDYLRGLILLDWSKDKPSFTGAKSPPVPASLPRVYALLKLLFLPHGNLYFCNKETIISHEPTIVPLLRAGRPIDAIDIAYKRLKSSGLAPLIKNFPLSERHGTRVAAALLIPIDEHSIRALARLVLNEPTDD